jgi:flagellar FliL protein
MFMGRGSAAPAPAAAVAEAPVIEGAVIKLDPLFINLKDERFLKLGIALQTSLMGKDPELDGSKALDAAIEVFSGQDIQQLSEEAGRSLLKEELLTQITEAYGSEVSDIYFTEFVMQ